MLLIQSSLIYFYFSKENCFMPNRGCFKMHSSTIDYAENDLRIIKYLWEAEDWTYSLYYIRIEPFSILSWFFWQSYLIIPSWTFKESYFLADEMRAFWKLMAYLLTFLMTSIYFCFLSLSLCLYFSNFP